MNAAMSKPKQSVALMPFGPSQSVVVNQFVDGMLRLDQVINEVFTKMTNRIQDINMKLQDLDQRAATAKAKVEKLKGSNKATKVFSSAHFPGNELYTPSSLHSGCNEEITFNFSVAQNATAANAKENKKHSRDLMIVDTSEKMIYDRFLKERDRGGLGGQLPSHLSSVASMVLFNTNHNPYQNCRIVDPLGVVWRKENMNAQFRNNLDDNTLPEAPQSLQDGDLSSIPRDEYLYLPELTDLPELDLPLELPFLPGVANDLLFEGGMGHMIAPSGALPDLPSFPFIGTDLPELGPPPPLEPTSIPPPLSMSGVPPPPPPPIPFSTPPSLNSISSKLPPPPPLTTSLLPPPLTKTPLLPPPPPPIPAALLTNPNVAALAPVKVPAVPKTDLGLIDCRSDLMRAIQAAGGAEKAKLRRVANLKKEECLEGATKTTTSTTAGGDFMTDLSAKLAQRRKGISGNPKADSNISQSGHSTLEKILLSIPNPTEMDTSSNDSDGGSDNDWSISP